MGRRRGNEVLGKDLGQEEVQAVEEEEVCGSDLTNRGETVHQISVPPAGAMASHDGPAPKQKGGVVRLKKQPMTLKHVHTQSYAAMTPQRLLQRRR